MKRKPKTMRSFYPFEMLAFLGHCKNLTQKPAEIGKF